MRLIDADALNMAFTMLRFNEDGTLRHWGDRQNWCLSGQEVEDLINSIPTIDPEPHWIPCSERLPEVGRSVLFSVGGMYAAEGCMRDDGDWTQFRWGSIQICDIVDAWMPLPKPYGCKQDEEGGTIHERLC